MRRFPVVSEALPWLVGLGTLAIVALHWWPALSLALLACLGLVAAFFRDPERTIKTDPWLILAPADGRVLEIDEMHEDRFLGEPAVRVSMFLAPWDAHLNRSPVAGRVAYLVYAKGRFRPAFSRSSAVENERNYLGIAGERGNVLVVQIAGTLARRIECWVREGDGVQLGQRIGMIRFGSRTDLFLPKAATTLLAKRGDRVKAGETIVGMWT